MLFQGKCQRHVVVALCFIISIIFGGGCANNQDQRQGVQTPAPNGERASMLVADKSTFSNIPVYRETNGLVWVPLKEAAKSMNLDLHRINDSFAMGYTDAAYTVKLNQTQALAGDNPIELPQAPKLFNQKPYITTQALSKLLGTRVNWKAQNSQVVITPINDGSEPEQQNVSDSPQPGMSSTGQMQSLSLTAANKYRLINFGDNFLGTPYKFSAGPYDETRRFDCSSFVQYVYRHFGVNLPRSSRSQSNVGKTVSANQLQVGDLMFFYTPGRYSSNRIVGHVGIYAGDGQVLHTYGKPGVTFTDFSGSWKRRFLFGKRVA